MGAAFETVSGYANPGTTTAGTYISLTAQNGQSFSIRNTGTNQQAGLMFSPFADFGVTGFLQIKSPRMHDYVIGTDFPVPASSAALAGDLLGGDVYKEPVWSTDTLTVQFTTQASQAAATSYVGAFDVYYPTLGGINANVATWAQVQSYLNANTNVGDHYVSWVRPSSAGTAGVLGIGVAINSTNDQFKANHTYALIGYLAPVQFSIWVVNGVDTGNLYVGGPGVVNPRVTAKWFADRSMDQGIACIPLIQANNKNTTQVSVADLTASTAYTVGLIWADCGIIAPVGG